MSELGASPFVENEHTPIPIIMLMPPPAPFVEATPGHVVVPEPTSVAIVEPVLLVELWVDGVMD